ncbi:MAG: Fe-S cluster assembly protein SufD [Thermoleophilaceae bacterium]
MAEVSAEPKPEPAWLASRRAGAGESPALPTFKGVAGWEFTDISGLDLAAYAPAGEASADVSAQSMFELPERGAGVEQVDGSTTSAHDGPETPTEPVVMSLSLAAERYPQLVERHLGTVVDPDDFFVARNDAGWRGGAFVYVPRGKQLAVPALNTLIQDRSGSELGWRTLIVLEEGSGAEIWEQYLSSGEEVDGVLNAVTEIVVGEDAHLRYVCGESLSEHSWIFATQRAVVHRAGSIDWVALGFGAARGRVRMETNLSGEGSSAKVTGAYATRARQHLDFDTTQEHAAAHTTSDLAFRGILTERSSAVWRGMIKVDPGAQQTDAFQESRNLLLSKRAHADAIPGLEIEANDVRCTHAAAIAQIDPDQVFYLMSRGLPRRTATRLVIDGFLQELVERFAEGPVRQTLAGALERRLEQVLGSA